MNKVIKINPIDMVAIASRDMKKGEKISEADVNVVLQDDIPMGHKIAVKNISSGKNIIRYGQVIGHATQDIAAGQWVHVHNVFTNLSDIIEYEYNPVRKEPAKVEGEVPVFSGYRRKDGQVGIRNELWIIPTVFCANGPAENLTRRINELYPRSSNYDGAYAMTHPNGCSQVGEDLMNTQKILSGLVEHPNAAGILLVGNGCEYNCMENFLPFLGDYDQQRIKVVNGQEVEDEIEEGLKLLDELYRYAISFEREEVPISELAIAVNCGGSDAFSGITANALVGKITDKVSDYGGTILMTEVPEMFGAEHLLMNMAADRDVFDGIVSMINDYKRYFMKYGEVIYKNPAPGNIAGGISTLEEKSLGCTQKGGEAIVTDVLKYGERMRRKGFNLISGPGNDLVGITAQEAAGCVLTIFTTGRGTPAAFAAPLIRVASNSKMANFKKNWIDYNAGNLLEGKDIDEAAGELLELILEVASGKQTTKSEANNYRQIGMLRDGITT